MEIEYIKANGNYYQPQKKGVDNPRGIGCYPVCFITKLLFGRWKIEKYDSQYNDLSDYPNGNQIPNCKIILYPAGIQEVKYCSGTNW